MGPGKEPAGAGRPDVYALQADSHACRRMAGAAGSVQLVELPELSTRLLHSHGRAHPALQRLSAKLAGNGHRLDRAKRRAALLVPNSIGPAQDSRAGRV